MASRLALQIGRHAHVQQFNHLHKALKRLKGYTATRSCATSAACSTTFPRASIASGFWMRCN
ncbi:hypothetical protein [Paracoccus saliphilus]|uniref:Transposase n=1 Tax=Paracoccus saliphilus TaxID=405559 RepID=A0ABY7SI36_9RHOB|nr:hypothetical protein [Paracoccus saliphilus]WCR05541.1 hypothetical protein JHX88_22040 [Paracoccus saliphilus]